MNTLELPNYFLADLPPEAPLSPEMVTAAGEAITRNRDKYLAGRKTAEIVKVLCEVGAKWREPGDKFRKMALAGEREMSGTATGFLEATVARGLDDFFGRFTLENFAVLLEEDLGEVLMVEDRGNEPPEAESERAGTFNLQPSTINAQGDEGRRRGNAGKPRHFWHGPRLLAHVAAGNIPNPALMSLTLGLLTRSAQFMKCASGASLLPRLYAHSIYEADPKLGSCVELAEWRGGNAELEAALLAAADCVTATGTDETLAAIRGRLAGETRFVGHGHRVSVGYVSRESLREDGVAELVGRVADDVVAWDQNGCLSPHVIFVQERGGVESDKFAGLLAGELMAREVVSPRGRISMQAAADIASRRAMYETLAACRGDVKLWQSAESTAWTVVFEHETRFHFSPLNRFIFVKPVPDLAAVLRGVDELKGKISTVAVAAPPDRLKEAAAELARWGVTRICAPGQMQNPPLWWRHDGRPPLGELVTWTDFEVEPLAGEA